MWCTSVILMKIWRTFGEYFIVGVIFANLAGNRTSNLSLTKERWACTNYRTAAKGYLLYGLVLACPPAASQGPICIPWERNLMDAITVESSPCNVWLTVPCYRTICLVWPALMAEQLHTESLT
ncbi:hypothetical protein AVEN_18600-1 [Araneus ventricosus]|uniref:Uncharacterized protein n=1 Tax=Araneus ventricosus TaxID=182803 RepID=A0A4Y2FSW2_ARAVE|nr:hypothetical protein AVEN_18600-1 [Araneus ventricosus]